MTLLIHEFEPGDRVSSITDMGWLKRDSVGIVTAVYKQGSIHPDALFSGAGETVIVAWSRTSYTCGLPEGAADWDGSIEGVGSVDISQFARPIYELPMLRHEIAFIDNLLK